MFGFHAVLARLRADPSSVLEIFLDETRNDARGKDPVGAAEPPSLNRHSVGNARAQSLELGIRVPLETTLIVESGPAILLVGFTLVDVTQLVSGVWLLPIASLIRTSAFFATDGFHPLLRIGEEIDLGRQITRTGDRLWPRSGVWSAATRPAASSA